VTRRRAAILLAVTAAIGMAALLGAVAVEVRAVERAAEDLARGDQR
jgi:hypothetical protein